MTDARVPRRSFLAAAATTMAAAACARASRAVEAASLPTPAVSAGSPVPSAIRLGVASYSLRNFPLARALEMVHALRTPYVNFKSVHIPYDASARELAALRAEIEASGVQIVGGGNITFDKDTDADVRHYFEYAKAAGMPLIVCTGAPAVLPRVERFAREFDIRIAIHNHGTEDRYYPSPYDVLRYVKDMDPRMGLCIDIGHTVRTGTDVVQAVMDAGPRLHDMHAKDLRDLKARESQCIVGEGALPIPAIFRALDAIRYPGFVNLEYEIDPSDPLPGMKQSFAYMRGVLAGMAPAAGTGPRTDR